VSILCGLEVDWLGEIKLLDDDAWSKVEVVVDDFNELIRRLFRGAVGVNKDGERLRNTDGVRKLYKCTAAKFGVDERFRNPSGKVSSRSVNLRKIFAGESSTTVGTPSTVGVDNDLSASKTSVALWSADDEQSRGLNLQELANRSTAFREITYMVDGLLI
jgi:hypothetical protein